MFSGIGGFELGIQRSFSFSRCSSPKQKTKRQGVEDRRILYSRQNEYASCIGYSEIDKYAIQIYQKHFPKHKGYGNAKTIKTRELPDFDLLVAGFPCQAFSIAGKREGFQDTRGTLFFEIARILKDKRPRYFLLENVKGLLSHESGKTFQTILKVLSNLGYVLQWKVLNSKNYGVPQNRERVFIVGHLRGQCRPKVFPIGEGNEEVGLQIKRIAHNDIFRRYNQTYDPSGLCESMDTSGGGGHQPCVPSKAKIRRLTPTECERLQSFPDNWTEGISDTQRYKCLGNAVTVNVIEAIMRRLL